MGVTVGARRYTGPDLATRVRVDERDGGCCVRCGMPASTLHHRRPRGLGGTDKGDANLPSNLLSLCDDCHRLIESYRAEAYLAGWLVSLHADPAAVPCLVDHGSRWVFLGADGWYYDDPPDGD